MPLSRNLFFVGRGLTFMIWPYRKPVKEKEKTSAALEKINAALEKTTAALIFDVFIYELSQLVFLEMMTSKGEKDDDGT